MYTIVEQIGIYQYLNPIIPITKKVLDTINISEKDISIYNIEKENTFDHNKELKNLDILFRKLKMIIDSHCYLTYEPMSKSLSETINRAHNEGVKYMLTISTEDKSFDKILKIISDHESVYGTYGIHPHEAKSHQNIKCSDIIKKIILSKKIIGIGETGLDFFIITQKKDQISCFEEHIYAPRKKFTNYSSHKIS